MRKAYLFKNREKSFNNSFHINDKALPSYNALKDPFLQGFFDKPPLKKHLQEIGLVRKGKKKRNLSNSSSKRPHTTSKQQRMSQ